MSNLTLPEWYHAPEADLPGEVARPTRVAGRTPGRSVRRALAALAEAITRELTTPLGAHSWLAAIEPRAKTIGLLLLTVGATLLQRLEPLTGLLMVAVTLALGNGLPIRRLARVWLGVPLFGLAIMLPATLNIVTHGPAVLTLWRFGPGAQIGAWPLPETLTVTQSGLVVAGRLLLRSMSCVSLMFLLVATTEPATLIASLRRLGMPRAFGMVLTMTHRYLVLLLRAAEEIHLAKVSRTIAADSVRQEQRWVAAGVGILFRRTYRLAQEVYAAMVSRGYDGDPQGGPASGWRLRDGLWLAGVCGLFAALLTADRWA